MNNPEINQTVTQPKPKGGVTEVIGKIKTVLLRVWGSFPLPVKNILIKFYANKKVFIPVTVAFGLIFLIIILGLLFGTRSAPVVFIPPKKTPTPFVVTTPIATPSGDILSVTEIKLKELNSQINSLDVSQQKLSPPAIDYDVSF
ncbi:MAG: hypothetical protein HYV90_01275 [Candidatus Woesebacteria bacterium]|nr:MAG: hypothetical protein HYV90_01275 [Candidatus Woesebacteria bacterium]